MIEALKNTYIKFNNKVEKRLIIELYEMAGFKFDASITKENGNGILCCEDSTVKWFASFMPSDTKQLTITQLAFEYGLAPDWADRIYQGEDNKFHWIGAARETPGFGYKIAPLNDVYATSNYSTYAYSDTDRPIIAIKCDNQESTPRSFKVGDSCQFKVGGEYSFVSGFIKFKGSKYIVLESCTGKEYLRRISTVELKPARTEKDAAIDLAVDHLVSATVSQSLTPDFYRAICESLYKAGMLKKPD